MSTFKRINIYVNFIVIILLTSCLSDKEEAIVENNLNGEVIYLLKTSWGNDDRMAIGLDNNLKAGFQNRYSDKYECDNSYPFFYKLEADTLHIYGQQFSKPKINQFKTKIVFHEICVDERNHYYNEFEKNRLEVFPESLTHILKNNK